MVFHIQLEIKYFDFKCTLLWCYRWFIDWQP